MIRIVRRALAALAASSLVLIGAFAATSPAEAANNYAPVWVYHLTKTPGAKQLWILLHDDGENAAAFCAATNSDAFAAAAKVNVACVTTPGNVYTGKADDLQQIRRITIFAQAATKVKRSQTFLVGFGTGADLTYRSACFEAPLYGGFATFAGQWPVKDPSTNATASWVKKCHPTAHRPFLSVFGTQDAVLKNNAATLKGWQTFTKVALGMKTSAKPRPSGFKDVTCQAVATKNSSVYCTWPGIHEFPIQGNAPGSDAVIATFDGLTLAAKFITKG